MDTNRRRIYIKTKKVHLRLIFAEQAVVVKDVNDGIWLVSFMDYDLGYFDEDSSNFEPLDNPFGFKV